MRKSASEVIRDLESRIAQLEISAHTMSKKDRSRLDDLQKLEDDDNLTKSQNEEYERLVKEYRKTPEYKGNKTARQLSVRESAVKVLEAMQELEQALESMPSFSMREDRFYASISDRWYDLHEEVKSEIKSIKGAY
jgi:hypothetical protein